MENILLLPKNYQTIDNDEMQYIDGGIEVYTNWWGISVYLTKNECRKLGYGYTAANIAASFSGNLAVVACISFARVFAQIGADNRGMWVNRAWTGNIWPSF